MVNPSPTIDVIIPVYKPGKKFSRLLAMLERQTYPVRKIIVINTEECYWDKTEYETVSNLEVHHISKQEFDHGGTRKQGVAYSKSDLFLCMTDDAVPRDTRLIERLVEGFSLRGPEGEEIAMVYARQLPDKECQLIERYTRAFNYPEESRVKTKADLPSLGIKTYFASNVCCAYNRKIYEKQGGFIRRAIFNEDMIFAGGAVQAGYGIVYQAEAAVIHSHNYSGLQQFQRNFDLAVSQADHPEVFKGIHSEAEGIRMVTDTALYLLKKGRWYLLPMLLYKSGCKYLGFKAGQNYRKMPLWMVKRCSASKAYWEKYAENNICN